MEQDKSVRTLLGLLRVAIATAGAESVNTDGVSWQGVYALARKQGVLALAFDGLVRLFEADKEFAKAFPQSLKLQWINATFHIESRYDYAKSVCSELTERWAEQGISTLCLKGFAFSTYYPVPNHRECGDFDCYLYDDYVKGNEIAKTLGAKVDDGWYKHSEIIYRKAMIENHRFIVAVRNGKKTKQLHNLLDSIARNEEHKAIADTKIEMPSTMFNALFMNYHTLTHFLSEGVRLRHILDWALFLEKEQHSLDWERFYALCDEFDMRAFVDCSTALAVGAFGVEITNPKIVVESPYTEQLFASIINDDDAVFSQSVGAWRKRVMLVRNLFASKWKYKAFTNRGLFVTFVSLVWGYFTHPEED